MEEATSFLFDMWQEHGKDVAPPKPDQPATFFVKFYVNFVVEYLPHRCHMNVRSVKETDFLARTTLLDEINTVHDNMFIRMLELMPLTEVDKESIKKMVATKAKLMDNDPRNTARDCIPVAMSLRVFYKKPYTQGLDLAWTERLGRSIHNSVPALESAVGDLDNVVYEKGSCLEDQCAICLGGFCDGEEITRLPCFHDFHGACLEKWLDKSHLCPFCRFPLPVCRDTEAFWPRKILKSRKRVGMPYRHRVPAVRTRPDGVL